MCILFCSRRELCKKYFRQGGLHGTSPGPFSSSSSIRTSCCSHPRYGSAPAPTPRDPLLLHLLPQPSASYFTPRFLREILRIPTPTPSLFAETKSSPLNFPEVLTSVSANGEHIDLDGKSLFPGFIDSHSHSIDGGLNLIAADATEKVDTLDQASRLRRRCQEVWTRNARRCPRNSRITARILVAS